MAALFLQTGCRENTIINTNLTPSGDSLAIVGEPVAIVARTVYSPFLTNTYTTGQKVIMGLGRINADPEIGWMDASMYMQVVPGQSSGYALPANIDSIVLVLPYSGFTYGDTSMSSTPMHYSAHYITEAFPRDAQYYNFSSKTYNTTALGTTTATVSYQTLKDSVTVGDQANKVAPHVRIPLDVNVLLPLLQNANYSSFADFLGTFNGLYVRVQDNGGNNCIPYFRLDDNASGNAYSRAGIVVYYHETAAPTVVLSNVLGFNPENCAFFNKIDYDQTAAQLDTANFLYLQGRPGYSIEISTKDVKNLPNRIVNKAELVITEVTPTPQTYFEPEYLYPYVPGLNTAGIDTLKLIEGAFYTSSTGTTASGLNFINGKATKVTIGGNVYNRYTINVPREFQKALIEKKEMTLRITGINGGYIGAFRLKAGKDMSGSDFNIRLNVVYSGVE